MEVPNATIEMDNIKLHLITSSCCDKTALEEGRMKGCVALKPHLMEHIISLKRSGKYCDHNLVKSKQYYSIYIYTGCLLIYIYIYGCMIIYNK